MCRYSEDTKWEGSPRKKSSMLDLAFVIEADTLGANS